MANHYQHTGPMSYSPRNSIRFTLFAALALAATAFFFGLPAATAQDDVHTSPWACQGGQWTASYTNSLSPSGAPAVYNANGAGEGNIKVFCPIVVDEPDTSFIIPDTLVVEAAVSDGSNDQPITCHLYASGDEGAVSQSAGPFKTSPASFTGTDELYMWMDVGSWSTTELETIKVSVRCWLVDEDEDFTGVLGFESYLFSDAS